MTDMIERVAAAMAAAEGWRWTDDRQMLDCSAAGLQNTSRERDSWRNRARVAIESMCNPTEHMLDCGACYENQDHDIIDEGEIARDVWNSMIDASLKATP